MSEVRVRFAPSPTGPLHIGGVRTALYNYLFAKNHGGKFLLRIEDTDQNRYVPGAEDYIIESLKWLGLEPDEGVGYGGQHAPYRQSERKEIYAKYAQELIDSGNGYYAFDTPEELDQFRAEAEAKGQTFIYNSQNRNQLNNSLKLSADEIQSKIDTGIPYVIRFKIPANETILLDDLIRGKISIDSNTLDDKVLYKSDGMPTYHLANIVDDHLMEITHVIRGEEWLPSMPLHELLYKAFGWTAPKFSHLPLILKPEGKGKLSKRDGDKHGFPVFPLQWNTEEGIAKGYREEGYLSDAMVNMLALLGWNPGTEQEIFTLDELIQSFNLEKVSKSGARFNPEKTIWFNHQYIQQKSNEEILPEFNKVLNENGIDSSEEFNLQVIDLLKERVNFIKDIFTQGKFFFIAPETYAENAVKKAWKEDSAELLNEFAQELNSLKSFDHTTIHDKVQAFVAQKEIGFGKLMMPVRLSLVGDLQGPDVPLIMELLGKDEVVKRLNAIGNKL
ncbi:glutamate--tRNA ligase [Moheibacter sediminis]|uniref:Glutamate--tRNA ligase n=1 Tax=Moheibacter sediminis TaxID=1434700 RepID=A0A1W1Y814_9FLAO|nr:glutamate--tRNA ligase [Moheibacter sediminis]SMC32312.1 glutamyl-tRNA synthetase [Moheibacter sediminis]